MLVLDIAGFVKELGGLGVKLTATRRMDGSFGLNKWRTMDYWDNAPQAETLWAQHVGDDETVIKAIAEFLSHPSPATFHPPSPTPMQRFASF